MKNSNYAKLLLSVLSLFLLVSFFFNLSDILLAQAPNRTLRGLLTNYQGKQVHFHRTDLVGVLKEINTDNILVNVEAAGGGTISFVIPFEAIGMIELEPPNHIKIIHGF